MKVKVKPGIWVEARYLARVFFNDSGEEMGTVCFEQNKYQAIFRHKKMVFESRFDAEQHVETEYQKYILSLIEVEE